MLVLSRKISDSILIDGGIKVTILDVKGNVVRLGVEAPKEVSIRRSEICKPSQELATSVAGAW